MAMVTTIKRYTVRYPLLRERSMTKRYLQYLLTADTHEIVLCDQIAAKKAGSLVHGTRIYTPTKSRFEILRVPEAPSTIHHRKEDLPFLSQQHNHQPRPANHPPKEDGKTKVT